MADKKISDLTAASSVADGDLFLIENSGGNSRKVDRANIRLKYRGALVRKASNQTGANYTTATAVGWDQEARDTDSIHDNVTNNTRLTVPSGFTEVELRGQIVLASGTADDFVQVDIRKNGSGTYNGAGKAIWEAGATTPQVQVFTAVLTVTGGDYFELFLRTQTDASVDITAADSWFEMKLIA